MQDKSLHLEDVSCSESDDEVVRELDVYLCKDTLPEGSKMYLLQSPLRPPWRPYELEKATNVQMKPSAGRLQIDVPLSQTGRNVNPDAEPAMKLQHLRLTSSPAALPTSFAVGTVREGKLLLVPVDAALQLRPSLEHMDAAPKPAAASRRAAVDAMEEEDEKPAELQAVKVNVQRRETDRQVESRLRSYSHHAKQESEEAWVPLKLYSAESAAAASVWSKLTSPSEEWIQMDMTRKDYLNAIVPGSGSLDPGGGGAARWEQGHDTQAMELGAPDAAPQQTAAAAAVDQSRQVPPGSVAGLSNALSALFKQHAVVDLLSIRLHLQRFPEPGAAAAGQAGDSALAQAVAALPQVMCVRGRFVLADSGDGRDNALRRLVLEMLEDKDSIKRGEVTSAAKARGIAWTDSNWQRVLKSLCDNVGSAWALKSGDIF